MRKALLIMLSGIFCALTQPMSAQIIAPDSLASDTLVLTSDTLKLTNDSIVGLDPDPEWYVAPEIPLFLRAPKHTAAAKCVMDSMLSFNVDSVLIEASHYEYDNAGRVIREIVWTYNADGSKIGKSKQEYSFDAYDNQVMTAVYAWDNATQTWKGTEKYAFVYDSEQRMISSIDYVWVTNEWKADDKKTWLYDAEGRVAEYFEYKRNTSNNELEKFKGFEKAWDAENRQTLDIQYTAAVNNVWTAGTKREYGYDENGNLTLSTLSTISNGAWIGSSKETWYYGGPSGEMTLYETYGWANNDWSKTLRAEKEFDDAGRLIRIENYTYPNGVKTGTKKEEYTFTSAGKPASTITYAWVGGTWVGATNETWLYEGPSGQLTLHEKFEWSNNDWSKTLKEETQYSGANIVRIENYTYANGVPTGTKKELTTYSGGKKTQILTFAWENGDWVNSNKETWEFNGPSGKQTKHEKCEWSGSDWTVMVQENTTYNGNTTTIENYERQAGVWTGTKKEENTVEGGKPTQTIIYAWDANAQDWVDFSKETWGYTAGKTTSYEKYLWENGAYVKSAREVWAYSGSQQTLYEKYTGQNDAWVGIEKEVWAFTSGKQTLHETYEWYNDNWSMTLREIAAFDAAGNQILIENYTGTNGTIKGTKKEEYTFKTTTAGLKQTSKITYTWNASKLAFIPKQWIVSDVDAAGNIIESCKYNYSTTKETWVGSGSRTLRTFDSNKNITDEIIQKWSTAITPNGWLNNTRTINEYNGKNQTLLVTYDWSTSLNDWVGTSRARWHYNAVGLNDTMEIDIPNGSEWETISRTVKTYDSNKNNILTKEVSWNGTAWVMTSMSKMDIFYDEAGRQVLNASWVCSSDSVWKGVKKDTAAYSATGKKLFEAKYTSWSNGVWKPSYTVEWKYDEKDREILSQRYDLEDGKLVGQYKYENLYDEQDRKIMTASYLNWNYSTNDWLGSTKYEYVYDGMRVVQQTSYYWGNGMWNNHFLYSYQFDAAGHEIEQLVQFYNNGAWENISLYVKEYHGSEIIKNNSYEWISNQWNIYNRNELYYDNDAQRKLRREVHGAWNNGAVTSFEHYYYMYSCDPCIIRFVNYDGTELESKTMDKGQLPSYSGATPVREGDAEYSYTFAGWTPEIVKVACSATYTATFTPVKNQYTITWLNDNDTQIDQTTVEYGVMPTHADPSKENTAEYTYTFTGWTPGLGVVTGEATYKATFNATKNSYTIKFLNYDGTELQSGEVEYGVKPTYDGATPTKPADDEFHYAFVGWNKEIVEVVGEEVYTATFDHTTNEYTISWFNDDNTIIDQTNVAYGEVPTHTDASKDNTAQYTYTFTGWSPTITAVTGNASYTAQFNSTVNKYTITFKNGNEVLQSSEVAFGEKPVYGGSIPTKDPDDQYRYAFAGWDKEIVEVAGEEIYTATFSTTTNEYTISWFNDDNTIIDQTTVAYGVVPTHEDPTKENTAEWTYTFSGWDHEPVAVTGAASYTAVFTATKNSYTITWLNEDGDEIEHETLEYGKTPEHTAPAKGNTAEWTYTFTGWTPAIESVKGDASYKATFNATKNSYTIKFLNYDGTELQSGEVEYGVKPTYDGATPTKPADDEFHYAFDGWDKEIVEVAGEETYTATFTPTTNEYTISWFNDDNSLIDQTTVAYGVVPTHDDPTKENTAEWTYTFSGWDHEPVAVTGAASYTAVFTATKNSYTITWKDDEGKEIGSDVLAYGETPKHEDLSKENTAEWTYTFIGWDPAIESVKGDASYKATFSATKNSYTIQFLNYNGEVLQSTNVEYGVKPVYEGAIPAKPEDDEFHYAFAGWDKEIVEVAGEETYAATFTPTTNEYTITWFNDDNTLIDQTTVAYGVVPTHDDPTKENTAEFTYTFAGWDHEPVAVTGAASYTAVFTATKNSYTITWLNEDGDEIEHETLEYGKTPEHTAPVKENTAEWTYTFTGWTPAIESVKGDASYKATFSATKNSYTIKFLNYNGEVLQSTNVEYGVKPVYEGAIPAKPEDDEFHYAFAGWDKEIVEVAGEETYTATFSTTTNEYTISWFNDDNTIIDQTTVAYGIVPTHEDPTKENTAEWTYTFSGWDPEIIAVDGDATYKATYSATKNSYTITWFNDDGSELEHETLEYGATPEYKGAEPSKEATAQYTYAFSGWDPEITAVEGAQTYTAKYSSTVNSYTITWLNEDGSELSHETLEYGTTPQHEDLSKENTAEWTYTFTGWDPEIIAVNGDATYKATYSATKNSYTITWLNDDGSEIEHETLEYGATPSHADIYKESTAEWIYTFAGWDPEIKSVTGDASYTATFDAVEATIYYHITVTADDAAHGQAGFVYTDAESSTLLTEYNVASGTWIELRAIASDDWHFDHWSDGDIASVRQIEVTEDMQITAHFASNCGDYPTLPVVSLYDWLVMLDVRSIHAMGYTFSEEDVIWYRVKGEPDKESDGAQADDVRVGSGYSFTLNESLINSGDYYAMVDVSSSPAGTLCSGMMRSQIIHFASNRAYMPPRLTPALVRPCEPQQILHLDPEFPTTVTIYDLSGHLLRTFSEESVDRMDMQAENVTGCYQVVVQNGDQRTVLRYIVVQ